MNRLVGIVAIVAAVILSVPYFFYSLLYRGLPGYLWVFACVLIFAILVYRFRHGSLIRLLTVSALSSAGVAIASLSIQSIVVTVSLLLAGFVVFGFASLGVHQLVLKSQSGEWRHK